MTSANQTKFEVLLWISHAVGPARDPKGGQYGFLEALALTCIGCEILCVFVCRNVVSVLEPHSLSRPAQLQTERYSPNVLFIRLGGIPPGGYTA